MSIQSTQYITREQAIDRIKKIQGFKDAWNFRAIERVTFEPELDVIDFISEKCLYLAHIENWTDGMLGDQMDCPFYRRSMFDNYLIGVQPTREDNRKWSQ